MGTILSKALIKKKGIQTMCHNVTIKTNDKALYLDHFFRFEPTKPHPDLTIYHKSCILGLKQFWWERSFLRGVYQQHYFYESIYMHLRMYNAGSGIWFPTVGFTNKRELQNIHFMFSITENVFIPQYYQVKTGFHISDLFCNYSSSAKCMASRIVRFTSSRIES